MKKIMIAAIGLMLSGFSMAGSAPQGNFGIGSTLVPDQCEPFSFADGRMICVMAYEKGCDVTPDSKFCVKKAAIFESKAGVQAPWLAPAFTCPTAVEFTAFGGGSYSTNEYEDVGTIDVRFDMTWNGPGELRFYTGPNGPNAWLAGTLDTWHQTETMGDQPPLESIFQTGDTFEAGFSVDLTGHPAENNTLVFIPLLWEYDYPNIVLSNVVITCTAAE